MISVSDVCVLCCLCLTHTLAVFSWSEVQMLCSVGQMFRCCVFSLCLMCICCDLCQTCSVHCLCLMYMRIVLFVGWSVSDDMCCVFVFDIHVLCSWSVSDARMLCPLCLTYMFCVGCSVSVGHTHAAWDVLCLCLTHMCCVVCVGWSVSVSEAHVLCCLCGMVCV